jgi:hypothetical protein
MENLIQFKLSQDLTSNHNPTQYIYFSSLKLIYIYIYIRLESVFVSWDSLICLSNFQNHIERFTQSEVETDREPKTQN